MHATPLSASCTLPLVCAGVGRLLQGLAATGALAMAPGGPLPVIWAGAGTPYTADKVRAGLGSGLGFRDESIAIAMKEQQTNLGRASAVPPPPPPFTLSHHL
jgi:hypothetical protein